MTVSPTMMSAWTVACICRYAQASLYNYVPIPWTSGSLTGAIQLPIKNIGNLTAPFNVSCTICCLSQANGQCNSTGVAISDSVQQSIAPSAIGTFPYTVSECCCYKQVFGLQMLRICASARRCIAAYSGLHVLTACLNTFG